MKWHLLRDEACVLTLLFQLCLCRFTNDCPNGSQASQQALEEPHLRIVPVADVDRTGRVTVVSNSMGGTAIKQN